MAVKTFQAKINTPHKRLIDYLWITHRIFNESLPLVIKLMRRMEKGKRGELAGLYDNVAAEKLRAVYCDMMGLDFQSQVIDIVMNPLPKKKRKNRSQNAHAWMEALTGDWQGKSSKTISPKIIALLQDFQRNEFRLFERDKIFSYGGDHLGFVRRVFDTSARRILNHEQNAETHEGKAADFKEEFDKWIKRESTNFSEFEKIRHKFETYEAQRAAEAERVSHKPKKEVRIDGAMCRGWDDILEELAEQKASSDTSKAKNVIKTYQHQNPKDIGDINFFLWLADKPNLWQFVRTIQQWNWYKLKKQQFSMSIDFTYPKPGKRPEWLEFSVSSPGNMYDLLSLNPGCLELAVFVPNEDVPLLKSFGLAKARKKDKSNAETSEETFLKTPVSLDSYIAAPEVIHPMIRGFFKDNPPLDLKRFTHIRVKFPFAIDSRLVHPKRIRNFKPGKAGLKIGTGRESQCSAICEYDRSLRSNKEIKNNIGNPDWVQLGFQAARLRLIKGSPYLDFTVKLSGDIKPELKIKFPGQKKKTGTELSEDEPPVEKKVIPSGYTTVAVDLGQRFAACLTALKYEDGRLSDKPLSTLFLKLPGLELRNIELHINHKSALQKKTYIVARGEEFAKRLEQHINKMKRDRAKKAANQIVRFALKNKTHCILFENLTGYRPVQEYGHRINKRLMTWNRRESVEWVSKIAQPFGIYVYDKVWPTYTSQRCSQCGSIGARFSLITKEQEKRDTPAEKGGKRRRGKPLGLKAGYYQVIRGGKMFGCTNPECNILNADFNASVNIGKRFFGEQKGLEKWSLNGLFQSYESVKDKKGRLWKYNGKALQGKEFFRKVASEVQKRLNDKFKQGMILPADYKPDIDDAPPEMRTVEEQF